MAFLTRGSSHYLDRMTDLIDKYQPDLLYTDGHLPFEDYGLKMVSHLYNVSAQLHGGKTEAVYTSKDASDCAIGTCLLDHERGVSDGIAAEPLADRHLHRPMALQPRAEIQDAKKVIDLLTDIVSKNGNLLLNFPLPNSGELDFEETGRLDGITAWMADQQRRHIWLAPLENLRRRPVNEGQNRSGQLQ